MNPSDSDPTSASREETPRESAGARLTAERRSLGLSLGDIARQLKLSVRQVEALERDDYASFAGPVFVRGFLRNYAKLLGLDPEQLIAAATPAPVTPTPAAPEIAEERQSAGNPERSRRVLTSVVIVALVVIAAVLLASNIARDRRIEAPNNDAPALQQPPASSPGVAQAEPPVATPATAPAAETPTPSAPPAAAAPAAPSSAPAVTPAPAAEAAPSAANATELAAKPRVGVSGTGPAQVRMLFEGESWVEVRDASGTTIYSRLNAAGTERLIRGTPPLSLVVGNASSVKVIYHDKPIDLLPHTHVDVARITLE